MTKDQEKKFTNEYLRYVFSAKEKEEIAAGMAQNVSELNQVEADKKAITSDFKSKTDGLQAHINNAAGKLNNGYEMRSIKCEMIPDWKKKVWGIMRTDTGEVIKRTDMTSEDLQRKMKIVE